jgi:SAM-dependent methyltransferase
MSIEKSMEQILNMLRRPHIKTPLLKLYGCLAYICGLPSGAVDGMRPRIFLYLKHKLKGSRYITYYAERMDLILKRETDGGFWMREREFQIDFLKAHGLRPEMTLLDYGCGPVGAGRHFIDFLVPGRYVGVDISQQCIEVGWQTVKRFGLESKKPELYHIPTGSLHMLNGRTFDVIWAQGVVAHTPPEEVHLALSNMTRHVHPGGAVYFNFLHPYGNLHHEPQHKDLKDWYYNIELFERAAAEFKMKLEIMDGWRHPIAARESIGDTMLRFTPLSSGL